MLKRRRVQPAAIGPIPLCPPIPPDVRDALYRAAPGWPIRDDRAGIYIAAEPEGFRVTGPGVARTADDAWEAAHWVLAAAIGAEAESRTGRFVLDAGAALFGGGAVVFAGESHAGKSSVALHLATLDVPLLGDDRLVIEATPPAAVGLGLARKVRTPLPTDFAGAARRLAAATRVGDAAGADVLAWDPHIDRAAGAAAPITRLVVLQRTPGAGIRRTRLAAAEAVAALLPLCGRHAGSAADLLDAVATLVGQVPVERLQAPDSATAAAQLAGLSP